MYYETITSRNNVKVKYLESLQNNQKSRRLGEIVLEGPNLIKEAFDLGLEILDIYASHELYLGQEDWSKRGIKLYLVTKEVMAKISDTKQPRGIVARVKKPRYDVQDLKGVKKILVLDGVQDPGNVGTLLRSAAAVGVGAALLLPNSADPFQPKALRASAGSVFRLLIVTEQNTDWGPTLQFIKDNYNIYLAEAHGGQYYKQVDYKLPWALVMGSEAHGIHDALQNLPDAIKISIPLVSGVESLNVATAGSILLFSM